MLQQPTNRSEERPQELPLKRRQYTKLDSNHYAVRNPDALRSDTPQRAEEWIQQEEQS